MTGKLIVIDGTDGSGKGTLTRMLVEQFTKENIPVATLSFPTYGTKSCLAVEHYLNGEFGSPEYTGPYFASMLYAFNRSKEAEQIREHLRKGTTVILNRYVSANAGHQGGKIADEKERKEFLDWVFHLEYEIFKLPKPDLTVFIHMPPAIGKQFLAKKKAEEREYVQGKQEDIHEADISHLTNAEQSFLYAAKQDPSWHIIECAREGVDTSDEKLLPEEKVRPLPELLDELRTLIKKYALH